MSHVPVNAVPVALLVAVPIVITVGVYAQTPTTWTTKTMVVIRVLGRALPSPLSPQEIRKRKVTTERCGQTWTKVATDFIGTQSVAIQASGIWYADIGGSTKGKNTKERPRLRESGKQWFLTVVELRLRVGSSPESEAGRQIANC